MTKPRRLKPGDKIGIIAPAGPLDPAELREGIDLLISRGYRVATGAHVLDRLAYLAGEDNARLGDFHRMIEDPDVKALFCARGGYGTLRFLDKIDFALVRENPKIIVGYSDVTALLLALLKRSGLVTFHGPMVKEFGRREGRNLDALLQTAVSEKAVEAPFGKGKTLRPGQASGRLLGGNLSLICHLIGTPYMPDLNGVLLFIEEKGEAVYRIDRMMTHLRLAGCLNGLAGLIAGSFESCGDPEDSERVLMDAVSGSRFPVVSGMPIGHGPDNLTLPMGLTACLDTERKTLSFSESCFAS